MPEIKSKCSIYDERPLSSLILKIEISEKGPATIQGIDKSYPNSRNKRFSRLPNRTEAWTDDMGCQNFLFKSIRWKAKDKTPIFKPVSHFHSQEAILASCPQASQCDFTLESATEKLQVSACLQQTDSCNSFSIHTNIQTQMPWVIKGINQDCLVELWFTKQERRLLCAVTPTYLWLFSRWKAAKELRHLKREIVQYAGNSTCNHVHFN